jgi:hypothetical protein
MRFPRREDDYDHPFWYAYLCGHYLEAKGFIYNENFDINNVQELAEEVFWREVEKEAA